MNHETIIKLLRDFERVETPARKRTFLEIAGCSRKENTISNVLAFFLDTEAEHELGDLVIKSILGGIVPKLNTDSIIDVSNPIHTTAVHREYTTDNRKRLDLIIETDDLVIGIENKIGAGLYNDLTTYAKQVEALAKDGNRTQINIVLAPKPIDLPHSDSEKNRFHMLTYPELTQTCRSLLGHYTSDSNTRYATLFIDFIKNLEHLEQANMNTPERNFLLNNATDLENITNKFQRLFNSLIPDLQQSLNEQSNLTSSEDDFFQFIWKKRTLVNQFRCKGIHAEKGLSIDTSFNSNEWGITIFSRQHSPCTFTPECHEFFRQISKNLLKNLPEGFSLTNDGNNVSLAVPLTTTIQDMTELLLQCFESVLSIIKNNES